RDDRNVVALAHPLAQGIHARGLARTDRSADTDSQYVRLRHERPLQPSTGWQRRIIRWLGTCRADSRHEAITSFDVWPQASSLLGSADEGRPRPRTSTAWRSRRACSNLGSTHEQQNIVMKRRVHLLLACAFAFTPIAAFAHPATQAGGFLQGLAHPIGGLDHLLAMIAVGVVARSFDGMQRWLLPLTFLTSMTLGALLGAAHFDVPFVGVFIALSLVGFGIIVARAGQSFGVAATLTAAF